MRNLHIIALCATLMFTGCQQDEIVQKTSRPVKVSLSLHTGIPMNSESRAETPLIPDVENLIYDIWVVQYDHEGIITKNPKPKHYRKEDQGLLSVNQDIELALGQSTVCMIVNMGYGSDDKPITFPDNLTEFKKTLAKVDVESAANGSLERIPMCGYWQGEVTESTSSLSVTLGRMMTRINLVLNNQTGTAIDDVTAELTNVPCYAHVFPSINSETNPDNRMYTTLTDEIGTIASNASVTRYFYIAPNLWTTPTTLSLGNININLGNDSPDMKDGSTKLYPNNIYTFTINLK